ncbi:hypothetical protein [[Phormidium] sp. ETS-05]|uniref:hypothetical protein n=1 Tax=[Phormidium] sp. ETS-05 TaxID=222819 RepID=UPI0018EED197
MTGFDFEMKGIKCTIFDTPGFCDGRENDDAYIDKIRDKVRQPDSMWYVSRLDETRPEDDERVIKIISKALGNRPWENAVIIFTFANNVKPEKYSEKLRKKTELIHKAIAQYMPEHEKMWHTKFLYVPSIMRVQKHRMERNGWQHCLQQ